MADALRALCAELTEKLDELNCRYSIPNQSALVERARAALEAAPEAARSARSDHLPPRIGHVFRLASIILSAMAQVDSNVINPTTLAEKILSDPRSQWAPAQEDKGHG